MKAPPVNCAEVIDLAAQIAKADRPVLLLGGGLSRGKCLELKKKLAGISIPIMTTWNGADRYTSDHPNYAGRPNTWGQRSSNILLQQSDLVVAIGSRLGLQQTGFNWQQFAPIGKVVQVDIDPAELAKRNPKIGQAIQADANAFLSLLLKRDLGDHQKWLRFCQKVRKTLPLSELVNTTPEGYLNPYDMVTKLSQICSHNDHIVPCSSGGAFTVMMQAFELRGSQTMLSNKGLASMGYGLPGAIGVAIADKHNRTILVEGDGGFTQSLQELATVAVNKLNLKMFIFCNEGYASIRMTQKNYFGGAYLGCDTSTGLGFPDWLMLAGAYGINAMALSENWITDPLFQTLFNDKSPALFTVPLHPEQSYFPKISSHINKDGKMESNPLHRMSPALTEELSSVVLPYMPQHLR